MRNTVEYIKTPSGEWYNVYDKDVEYFVRSVKKVLGNYVTKDMVVGLFINFDYANFTAMLIYRACISCGAAVIRCGLSDLDRQLLLLNSQKIDVLICSKATYRSIENRINYEYVIFIEPITNLTSLSDDDNMLKIYELFDIPGVVLCDQNKLYFPGYTVSEPELSTINSSPFIEGYSVSNYNIGFLKIFSIDTCEVKMDKTHSFIMMQIPFVLRELLCGKIDDNGNISLSSLGMVELLCELEERFDISVSLESIKNNSFENIFLLSKLILDTVKEESRDESVV